MIKVFPCCLWLTIQWKIPKWSSWWETICKWCLSEYYPKGIQKIIQHYSKLKPDSWVLLVSLIPTLARCLLLAKVQIWSFFCRPDSLWASMGPNLLAGTFFCFCDVFWLWTCSSCRCCSGCSSSGCTGIPFAFCSSCAASSRLLVDRFCFLYSLVWLLCFGCCGHCCCACWSCCCCYLFCVLSIIWFHLFSISAIYSSCSSWCFTGWWFGTFFSFPYIGLLIIPID